MHFAICDFLLDLVQNSIEAGASDVSLTILEERGWISAEVTDNGKGMDAEELKRAKDPFYTDGRKHAGRTVGLGIPFLLQSLEQAGGTYHITSSPGVGTGFSFRFPADGMDTPPLGDVPGLIVSAWCFDGPYELKVIRKAPERGVAYAIKRSEMIGAVGDLTDAGALLLAREFLNSNEATSNERASQEKLPDETL